MNNESSSKNFAKRLNHALDLRHYPPLGKGRIKYLQEVFGLSRAGANKWMHGISIPHKKKRVQIAEKLGISLNWLETGEGDPLQKNDEIYHAKHHARSAPLLSMAQAYDWKLAVPEINPDEHIVIDNSAPDHAFAVKLIGNSMFPRFTDGCILLIDPDAEIIDGDYVLAKSNTIPEAIFRQFIVGSSSFYLVPLNTQFEPITIPDKALIIGKIIEVRSEL